MLEYEVVHTIEQNGIPRNKAEAMASAMLEANKNPDLFNRSYHLHQLESSGFSEKEADGIVSFVEKIFLNQYRKAC